MIDKQRPSAKRKFTQGNRNKRWGKTAKKEYFNGRTKHRRKYSVDKSREHI